MRRLLPIIIFLLFFSILFVNSSTIANNITNDKEDTWIQAIVGEQNISMQHNDFILYCTGHHGIIWSLIAYDSLGIFLHNGTTRNHVEFSDCGLSDSLSFINDNIKTIMWGFDSLSNFAHLLKPLEETTYNPIYNQFYVIKDGNITFRYNDRRQYYAGSDSIQFHGNFSKLAFLMFWLASPTCRPYLPLPSDSLLLK
nr:hypothetical protein [Bacteroides sp.]